MKLSSLYKYLETFSGKEELKHLKNERSIVSIIVYRRLSLFAVLIIRGFQICYLLFADISLVIHGFLKFLAQKGHKTTRADPLLSVVLVFAQYMRDVTPANNEGRLYSYPSVLVFFTQGILAIKYMKDTRINNTEIIGKFHPIKLCSIFV